MAGVLMGGDAGDEVAGEASRDLRHNKALDLHATNGVKQDHHRHMQQQASCTGNSWDSHTRGSPKGQMRSALGLGQGAQAGCPARRRRQPRADAGP